jgi:hypothetical protein
MEYMIEITHDKVSDLAENVEKALRYMGKAMQCVDDMKSEGGMQERRRGGYGNRSDYGGRGGYGNRGEFDDAPMMGGRYSQY